MSSVIPVAAEDENILTIATGNISEGILKKLVKGVKRLQRRLRQPELLNIPTATKSPTKVGAMSITILNPSFTPSRKTS
mgnify:CR=1 FL=1